MIGIGPAGGAGGGVLVRISADSVQDTFISFTGINATHNTGNAHRCCRSPAVPPPPPYHPVWSHLGLALHRKVWFGVRVAGGPGGAVQVFVSGSSVSNSSVCMASMHLANNIATGGEWPRPRFLFIHS